MGQEFIIKAQGLEDKINQLLPSQGGFQAGVDLSASTTIIPIVDLTETAEGSNLRSDLQSSLSFVSCTPFDVTNTTTTVVNTTGYFRLTAFSQVVSTTTSYNRIIINDGTTDKIIYNHETISTPTNDFSSLNLDFIFFLTAGDSLKVSSFSANSTIKGQTRQLADINGNLVNPL